MSVREKRFPLKPTARSERINPFYVMELLEQAREMERGGMSVVHMEIGEPDLPTPKRVKDAAIQAIQEGRTFYTESLGLPELREKIAEQYQKLHGVQVAPERVVVTNGTSGAFLLLASVLLGRGRNLLLPDPGYPCYKNFGRLVEAAVKPVPVQADSRFEIHPRALGRVSGVPHMVLIANPSNPTGNLYEDESLARLWSTVSRKGGVLVVDEIYSGLVYGSAFKTALALSDQIIVVNGFSKTHAMTGWRLGWMVVPQALVRPIQKVAQNVFISAPTISQYAALAALDAVQEVETMRKTYLKRRNYLVPALRRLGFSVPIMPQGAFYVYAGIDAWRLDSMVFVQRALKEAAVAVTPGYDFGSYLASSHVRFSYANDLDKLKEGCRRLGQWLPGL